MFCASCRHAAKLREAGADQTCVVNSEAGLNLGSTLLADLGTPETDISLLRRGIHEALAVRTAAALPSRRSGSASIDSEALHSLSSMDSASGSSNDGKGMAHALSMGASVDSHSGEQQERKQSKKSKKKDSVELFVLDGRMTYGFDARSRPASAAADVVERPCSDCPLLVNSAMLQQPATSPTAAAVNGAAALASSANGSAEAVSNGSSSSVPAAAAEAVSAVTGSSNSPNSL